MERLYGDGMGKVVELAATVCQPWRCQYEDKHYGQCVNDVSPGEKYCPWHLELIALHKLADPSGQKTDGS